MTTIDRLLITLLLLSLFGCTANEPDFAPRPAVVARDLSLEPPDADHESGEPHDETGEYFYPSTYAAIAPADLMTSVGHSPLEVVFGVEVPPEHLTDVYAGISLAQVGGDGVALDFEVVPPTPGSSDQHIIIRPQTALADDVWYELSFDPERVSTSWGVRVSRPTPSRFRVGSLPVVRGALFSPGDDAVGVVINFSEPVHDERPAHTVFSVLANGDNVQCEEVSGGALSSPVGTTHVGLVCEPFELDSIVRIHLDSRLRSMSGEAVIVPFGEADGGADRTVLAFNPTREALVLDTGLLGLDVESRRSP